MRTPTTGRIARFSVAILAAALLSLISSCRSMPEGPFPDITHWLPEESDIILRLNIRGNTELTDMLINRTGMITRDLTKVRDRAAVVAVGLEMNPDEDSPAPLLHLVSVGIWPKSLIGSALGSDWKKTSPGRRRWTGPGGMELAVLSDQEIILSGGKVDVIMTRAASGASSAAIDRANIPQDDTDMSIWLTDPEILGGEGGILRMKNSDGSPAIELIGLQLSRVEQESYMLTLDIYPSDTRLSGSLALALRLGMSARFGLSPIEAERSLMSGMTVKIEAGSVRLIIPSIGIDVMDGILEGLNLFPEAAE